MENFQSFPFLTMLLSHLYVKYVTIPAAIKPRVYGSNKEEIFPSLIKSNIPIPIDATDTGKYNMNVYFRDELLDSPHSKHPTKVAPLLDIPGIKAIICIQPMIIASL